MYLPNFLDGFDRLVAFDAETTGKRTPDADFIRRQPFAWKPPGIIIEVGFVEMLRDGIGWRKGETWCSLVNPDGPRGRGAQVGLDRRPRASGRGRHRTAVEALAGPLEFYLAYSKAIPAIIKLIKNMMMCDGG